MTDDVIVPVTLSDVEFILFYTVSVPLTPKFVVASVVPLVVPDIYVISVTVNVSELICYSFSVALLQLID